MSANKGFERKCAICRRKEFNGRMLGPLIATKTISAHFNCVLFSPITPDTTSLAPNQGDDAIAGVSSRFIREEGKRACQLVIFLQFPIFFPSYSYVRFASHLLRSNRFATIASRTVQTLDAVMTLEVIR